MILTKLAVDRFRNLQHATLLPGPGINLITGANGAGKTSLLESIQCLSTGHSFRTRKPRELIAHSASEFLLTCEMQDPQSGHEHRAGLIRRVDGSVDLRFDFEPLRSFQTATSHLPVKALTPESHGLVEEGPRTRRQFIDWGVFHVEHGFLAAWRAYQRSLAQRNTALRLARPDNEVVSWDQTLVESADQIDRWRRQYVIELAAEIVTLGETLDLMFHVELDYRPGWPDGRHFAEALAASMDYSRRMKTTTVGPHRSDLIIRSDQHLARTTLSRGQQKLLVYALELAQLQLLDRVTGRKAVVLCDDLQAELDPENFQRVLGLLTGLGLQTFVSTTSAQGWTADGLKRFDVADGRVENAV